MKSIQVFDGDGDDPDEADRMIQAAIDAIDAIPPVKPKLSTGLVLREGDARKPCPICASSQQWYGGWWWTLWMFGKKAAGCINSGCRNFYRKKFPMEHEL